MMMEWLLVAYISLLPFLLMVLLCGEKAAFEGTVVQKIHHYIFGGGSCDSLQRLINCVFGNKGSNACESAEQYCCGRPNPFLQLFYLAILFGSYYTISSTSLQFIPGYYLSFIHRYTGPGAACIGLLLFLATSFLDPGTITAATLEHHASSFPYDGIIYEEKMCSTCNLVRPARSKHCSICDRCIARFDHHCGWMNNCIGENNLRFFLSFLIWHVLLCWYGVYLLAAILAGEVKERGVIRAISFYHGGQGSFWDVSPYVLQWLLTYYSAQVLMMVFLTIVSLLLVGFSGYHFHLVLTNTTTNETYKWDGYQRWQAELVWSRMQTEEIIQSQNSACQNETGKSGCCDFLWKKKRYSAGPVKPRPSSFKKENLYNRGLVANIAEVIFPMSHAKCKLSASRKKD